MGKKKNTGEYNDFLDGEKLRDNAEPWTLLQGPSATGNVLPPPPIQNDRNGSKSKAKPGSRKPPLTHFLCLPLITDTSEPQLQSSLSKLKADLETDDLIPSKAVRPVGTLHLTLGVMSLDDTQISQAQDFLQDLDVHIVLRDLTHQLLAEKAASDGLIAENFNAAAMPDTDALTISLESLVPMQQPDKTSILYAEPVDGSGRLLSFAEQLKKRFEERGLMVSDQRDLRLHATVVNTIYAKNGSRKGRGGVNGSEAAVRLQNGSRDTVHESPTEGGPSKEESEQGHGPNAKSWLRFDARSLIVRYKGFVWAENVKIDRVQICKMGARKTWSGGREGEGEVVDEQYEVVAEKALYE